MTPSPKNFELDLASYSMTYIRSPHLDASNKNDIVLKNVKGASPKCPNHKKGTKAWTAFYSVNFYPILMCIGAFERYSGAEWSAPT